MNFVSGSRCKVKKPANEVQKLHNSLMHTIQERDSEPLSIILNAAANYFLFIGACLLCSVSVLQGQNTDENWQLY